MIGLLWVLLLFYSGFMLFLLFGIHKVQQFAGNSAKANTRFSIVIPFRNEAAVLPDLFRSLKELKYPAEQFEVILVNDDSEDESEEMCRVFRNSFPSRVLVLNNKRQSGSPKKDALNTAIQQGRHEYILTTDADCRVPETWLSELDSFIEESGAKFIAGPVRIDSGPKGKTDFIKIFQEVDFLSLQAASIGGFGVDKPFLCNGVNLCYEKESFLEVGGFEGNEQIASGDDVFLLEKMERAGIRTAYLKSRRAIVTTAPQPDLRSLISQRRRWAAKTPAYKNFFGKAVGLVVLGMNLSLVIGFIWVLFQMLPQQPFLIVFLVKFNVDFLLIYTCSIFFQREKLMKNYFWCSFVYPLFSSYTAVSYLFSGYRWKGRRFRR